MIPAFAAAVALIGTGIILAEMANTDTLVYEFTKEATMNATVRADRLTPGMAVLENFGGGRMTFAVRQSYRDWLSGTQYVKLANATTGSIVETWVHPAKLYMVAEVTPSEVV